MAQIVWTEPALDELNAIAEYIALSNPFAAKNLIKLIFQSTDRLRDFPDSGRIPEELKGFEYREVVINPCRVFYRIAGKKVFILHVLRQERDVRRYIIDFETE